jgi:phytoene dehydrogenase-like protein
MSDQSIIIIGAGISGLSAGCYGQLNGYRTQIFEMHNKSGGVCTSWKRKGYTIGTAGWLSGSRPENNDFHAIGESWGWSKACPLSTTRNTCGSRARRGRS